MHKRVVAVLGAVLFPGAWVFAKDKNKVSLPPYVLQARTVMVIVDPGAGMSVEDPQANRVAQKDVESALLSWARFEPVLSRQTADLIVVVRKGNGRVVNQTVGDPRQGGRAGSVDPYDGGISIGTQHGQPAGMAGSAAPGLGRPGPQSQTEIGETDDSFAVYQGHVGDALENSPAWRYVARDGLRPHAVPAVAEFRKALAEAEKAAAKRP